MAALMRAALVSQSSAYSAHNPPSAAMASPAPATISLIPHIKATKSDHCHCASQTAHQRCCAAKMTNINWNRPLNCHALSPSPFVSLCCVACCPLGCAWLRLRCAQRELRVSSVLNGSREYGKQNLFDGAAETCWNSDQGTPQFSQLPSLMRVRRSLLLPLQM